MGSRRYVVWVSYGHNKVVTPHGKVVHNLTPVSLPMTLEQARTMKRTLKNPPAHLKPAQLIEIFTEAKSQRLERQTREYPSSWKHREERII